MSINLTKGQKRTSFHESLIIFLSVLVISAGCTNQASFNQTLIDTSNELNKSCPIMVDQDTRLDNTMALPENVFQYNYTLINMDKSEVDVNELTNYLTPIITNNIKTNPDLKIYRENKTTMSYFYKDKAGKFLTKIEVTPEDYEE